MDVAYLRAELAFRLGRIDAADEQFREIDITQLDRADATRVVRRRATILFHVRGRFGEAVDSLTADNPELDTDLLRSHAVGLLGFLGYADRVSEIASTLPDDLTGPPELEVIRGRAQAALVRGRFGEALDHIARHAVESADVEPDAAQAGNEVALAIQVQAYTGIGEINRALDVLRAHLPVGRRTMLAWLPLAACIAHLAAGHPRAARALIMTPLTAVRSQNLIHAEPLMTSSLARATAHLGDTDAARAQLEMVERSREGLIGRHRWAVNQSVADALLTLGDRERAIDVAGIDVDDAVAHGATAVAAEMLTLKALAGAADDALPLLQELAADFDGSLWPLRLRHVEALARGADDELAGIAAEYEGMGYGRLATLAHT